MAPITFVGAGDLHPVRGLEVLPAADVRLVNLEEPLTARAKTTGLDAEGRAAGRIRFAGDPATAALLRGHVEVATLANNHALDQSEAGRADTVNALSDQAIAAAWAGRDAVLDRGGRRITVIARDLGETDEDDLLRAVESARGVVVVSVHWGNEGSLLPNRTQRRLAARLVDAGAIAVLGHGPHTIQGLERRGKAIVAYSLGNLALSCRCGEVTDSFVVKFTVNPDGAVTDVHAIPIHAGVAGEPPARSSDPGLLELIATLSRDLGSQVDIVDEEVRIR